jgi:DNA-directed RNA polymerase subunit RPC12/RpoP
MVYECEKCKAGVSVPDTETTTPEFKVRCPRCQTWQVVQAARCGHCKRPYTRRQWAVLPMLLLPLVPIACFWKDGQHERALLTFLIYVLAHLLAVLA